MHTSLPLVNPLAGIHAGTDTEASPILIELTKKTHFCRFLEKEIATARTEAEKEAVQTILLKTKIEIRAIEEKWKRTQMALHRASRSASSQSADACPAHRMH